MHNYNKYANQKFAKNDANNKPELEETATVEEVIEKEVVLVGVVANCGILNVREKPAITTDVIGTIKRDTEVKIIESESTDEFYKVITSSGMEGFCMKEYITIK